MARMSEASKAQLEEAVRHPVKWLKGADLPEEQIRPWEGFIQFWGEGLKGFMSGFTGLKDLNFVGMGPGMIPPNWMSVSSVTNMLWSGFSDPVIGTWTGKTSRPGRCAW